MPSSPVSTHTPASPKTPSADVLDGVTGVDDGGREDGDVELALFRRIRSLSSAHHTPRLFSRPFRHNLDHSRYFIDPLSMFKPNTDAQLSTDQHTPPAHIRSKLHTTDDRLPLASQSEQSSTTVLPDAHAQANLSSSDRASSRSISSSPELQPTSSRSQSQSQSQTFLPAQSHPSHMHQSQTSSVSLLPVQSQDSFTLNADAWRDANLNVCASLLGKTVPELQREFNNTVYHPSSAQDTAFPSHAHSFEPTPRDLPDYAIMTTLKKQDAFAVKYANTWLFNLMDRTGAGFVLRDEFVRYAPFIGPVADAAVAGIVFDELIREQVRQIEEEEEDEEAQRNASNQQNGRKKHNQQSRNNNNSKSQHNNTRQTHNRNTNSASKLSAHALRRRTPHTPSNSSPSSLTLPTNPLSNSHRSLDSSSTPLSRDLFPPTAALRFELWRRFFLAVQDKHYCEDNDWAGVKQQLGIDPCEVLIKSQNALDHSDIIPTLGKLYLSQRYLIFFAAMGRNHYVVRLGAIADVANSSIPLMMRDCIKITLESETKAALHGVSAKVAGENDEERENRNRRDEGRQQLTLSQHIGRLMKQFTAGRKPLSFSLLEFRETKRRDNWVNLVREMVAAYKLHVQLGFGSSGRAVPALRDGDAVPAAVGSDSSSEEQAGERASAELRTLNYTLSPFRNEPSPPLLAVAAHANIVRYRALRRVTKKRVSTALLVFSHPERNPNMINWYSDSVRAYNNKHGRSWIERALAAIRENMDTNNRMYAVEDSEPFDIGVLTDVIGRFAELCAPLVRVVQFLTHLSQWRNPPATILAMLVCVGVGMKGWVHYVPAALFFLQAAWVVETKLQWFGLGMGRAEMEDANERRANVLAMVAQVHDALVAAQNVLALINRQLGKVQLLFLWGCEEWQSWVAVGALCGIGVILLIVPSRVLFAFATFIFFFRHFLPPTNRAVQYWQSIPSRIETRRDADNDG